MDVSARGLRMDLGDNEAAVGDVLTIEILLEDPIDPAGPPRLVLDGQGRVVWVEDIAEEGRHAGVEFDAPFDLRRSFPQVTIF